MKQLTVNTFCEICYGEYNIPKELRNKNIKGVVIDSRKVENDYIFIATIGERVDGHDFIETAMKKGAMLVICQTPPKDKTIPHIVVKNSFQALKEIAIAYRETLTIPVVGITGSVGKTSTKEFVSAVLSQKKKVLKTAGNYNNEIGLPLTVLEIEDDHEVAVLEMGISEFGEMHRLSNIAKPDICVLTNIGFCHLENLLTREGVLQAKSEIFDFMSESGIVCLNGDDDQLITIEDVKGKTPIRFGLNDSFDVYATNKNNLGLLGSTCDIMTPVGKINAEILLPGEHMIYNALAATAVGLSLGLSLQEIQAGITAVLPVDGRSNLIKTKRVTLIDDCYNANPNSMKAALDLLKTVKTRTVAILGDMFELGADFQSMHEQVGEYALQSGIDVIICVGNLSKSMYDAAKKSGKKEVFYFSAKEELLLQIKGLLCQNDTVLLKASHGMGFEKIISSITDF